MMDMAAEVLLLLWVLPSQSHKLNPYAKQHHAAVVIHLDCYQMLLSLACVVKITA